MNRFFLATEFDIELMNGELQSEPTCAVDSDFVNDPGTARSMTGFLLTFFGTAVSWRSHSSAGNDPFRYKGCTDIYLRLHTIPSSGLGHIHILHLLKSIQCGISEMLYGLI